MATYNGYKGKRIVMRDVTEEQKENMSGKTAYQYITFKPVPGSDLAPVGVDKKVKPAPVTETKQEGVQDAQEK